MEKNWDFFSEGMILRKGANISVSIFKDYSASSIMNCLKGEGEVGICGSKITFLS